MTDMLRSMSGLMQRITAAMLFLLAILLFINLIVMPLIDGTNGALDELDNTRFERARAQALDDQEIPEEINFLPSGLILSKVSEQSNIVTLGQLVHQRLSAVVLNSIAIQPDDEATNTKGIVSASLNISGRAHNIAEAIAALENGAPIIRLTDWQIVGETGQPGVVRLTAKLIAVRES